MSEIQTGNNLVVVVKVFQCEHWITMTTANSQWCHQCAKKVDPEFPLTRWGWMKQVQVKAVEFTLQENGEITLKELL